MIIFWNSKNQLQQNTMITKYNEMSSSESELQFVKISFFEIVDFCEL